MATVEMLNVAENDVDLVADVLGLPVEFWCPLESYGWMVMSFIALCIGMLLLSVVC